MKRLQFWRKGSGKKKDTFKGKVDEPNHGTSESADITDSEVQINKTPDLELNKTDSVVGALDPDYATVEDVSAEDNERSGDAWKRDSTLSFETFKGPQAVSQANNDGSDDDDKTKLIEKESTDKQSSFEVIYSQVNKNKIQPEQDQDPSDTQSTEQTLFDSTKTSPDDLDSVAFSFDDVLESFRLSVNELQKDLQKEQQSPEKSGDDKEDSMFSINTVRPNGLPGTLTDRNDNDDIPFTIEHKTVPIKIFANGIGNMAGSQPDRPMDLDLMMSDEVIFRPRKKSVTFSEYVHERPLSVGSTDVILNHAGIQQLPENVSGGNQGQVNGSFANEPKETVIALVGTNFMAEDDQEITQINENVKDREVDSDDALSVTSVDDIDSEEEELLKQEPLKIRRLMKTRTVMVIVTWMCAAVLMETITTTFPMTQYTLNAPLSHLGRALITKGVGGLLAAILTGIVCTHLSCDLFVWLIIGIVTMATSLAWLPWCSTVATVFSSYALCGAGEVMILVDGIIIINTLWNDQKRDLVIHLMFVFRAFGSAAVPQITRYLLGTVGNWTTFEYEPDVTVFLNKSLTNGDSLPKSDNMMLIGSPETITGGQPLQDDFEDAIIQTLIKGIPKLFPFYAIIATLGIFCSLVLCGVIGYKNLQIVKRDNIERTKQFIRKKKLKKDIKVLGLQKTVFDSELYKTEAERVTADYERQINRSDGTEMDSIMAEVREVRQNGMANGNVEHQLTKLVAYAKLLEKQKKEKQLQGSKIIPGKERKLKKPTEKWLQGDQSFGVASQMFLYVFFLVSGGLILTFSQFLFLYSHHHMRKNIGYEEYLVFTLFWGSMAVSRIIVIPVSKVLSPNGIMITCLVTNLSSSAVMIAYADRYPVLLWLFGGLIGISLGPLLPGGLTWANLFFNLRAPKTVALIFAFWSVGAMLLPWICGFVVDNWGLPTMFYMTLSTCGLALILYVPVLVVLSRRRDYNFGVKRPSLVPIPARTYL